MFIWGILRNGLKLVAQDKIFQICSYESVYLVASKISPPCFIQNTKREVNILLELNWKHISNSLPSLEHLLLHIIIIVPNYIHKFSYRSQKNIYKLNFISTPLCLSHNIVKIGVGFAQIKNSSQDNPWFSTVLLPSYK